MIVSWVGSEWPEATLWIIRMSWIPKSSSIVNWSGTVASGGTSRSCVGSSTVTRGASSLVTRTSNRTTSWLRKPSVSFSSIQNGCDSLATKLVEIARPSAPILTCSLATDSPRRSVAEAIALLALASNSIRVPSTTRTWVLPAASSWGLSAVYSGATTRTTGFSRTGGGTTWTGQYAVTSSPASTENLNGFATDSTRPRNVPSSGGRSGSVVDSPSS